MAILIIPSPFDGESAALTRSSPADGLPKLQPWQFASSCGGNALYCLLRIEGCSVKYDQLLDTLAAPKEGSSLEELRSVSTRWKLPLNVYKTDRQGFPRLRTPFIAHLEDRGTRHYVLVLGREKKDILTWDIEGGAVVPIKEERFFKLWTGYALATGTDRLRRVVATSIGVELIVVFGLAGIVLGPKIRRSLSRGVWTLKPTKPAGEVAVAK